MAHPRIACPRLVNTATVEPSRRPIHVRIRDRYVRVMLRRTIAAIVLSGIAGWCTGQTTSSLSGTITDAGSQQPVADATVEVVLGDTAIGSITDTQGAYRFTSIPTGIHSVRIRKTGYASLLIPEVWVRAGKEEVVDVALQARSVDLNEAEVIAIAPRPSALIGSHELTVEQSLRYPAMFFDPGRVAATRPGVATTNDQANHFSVRGNSPASNAWMLEGAEIVNPNHLGNAGTASDLPTLGGGGVNILSAQMLGPSRLLTGGFDAAYGNAIGGIMDMRLRKGIRDRQAFTLQAGLIGLDLSTEGPIRTGGRSSYLINYRYSTLGLLSSMGVDLGDEQLGFQDLSFDLSFPMDRGSFTLFGLGGMSHSYFDALPDSADWKVDKDSQNIDYDARMGAVGGTMTFTLGPDAVWQSTVVLSANDQVRKADGLIGASDIPFSEQAELGERKLCVVSHVRGSYGSRLSYRVGGSALEREVNNGLLFGERTTGWLLRPYAQGTFTATDRLKVEVGVADAYYSFNGSNAVEPRANIQWRIGDARTLSIAAGERSQLPNVQFFPVVRNAALVDNSTIGLTRSQDISLAYDHPIQPHLLFHAEVFHQRVIDVPVSDTTGVLFNPVRGTSLVNAFDAPVAIDLVQNGMATNQGLELSFQHLFHRSFFYRINLTVFDATYTDANNDEFNSRWNTGLIGNLMAGKEFAKQKERVKRTWGVNGRLNASGGQRFTPVPRDAAQPAQPYSDRYDNFFRIDLRIYLKREHQRRTGMWAMDLQNVTNAKNEAYRYFDVRKNELVTKYQLGLIPNLSYRIEF